jgi:hypothetical protein
MNEGIVTAVTALIGLAVAWVYRRWRRSDVGVEAIKQREERREKARAARDRGSFYNDF